MKRKLCKILRITAITLIVICAGRQSANAQACGPAASYHYIDINNIRARINNGGDMLYDPTKMLPQFNVPKVTQPGEMKKHSIFVSSLWVGAYSSGNLKAAAMTYRQSGVDFFAGPLSITNGTTTNTECQKWDKVWRINKSTIDSFKAGLFTSIPVTISDWPAHGDVSKGQAKNLAPFVDVDNDGSYNPSKGDYPDIKGDQMLWWIFNDKGNIIHGETNAEPLGIEVHASAYALISTQSMALNHTIFVDYKIFNRSKNRFDSLYVGNFTDFDLGNPFDDYVGSDSVLNSYFAYNGDNIDEGIGGYGINPPVQSVIFLNKKLNKFIFYNNDFSVIGNPSKPEHYYFFLTGRWKDGQCMKYGGDGRIPGPCANLMFPSPPESNNPSDWNERIAANVPADRRGLGSSGPYTLQPEQPETFKYAYVFSSTMQQRTADVTDVKKFYANNIATKANPVTEFKESISVYPNPANEQIFVSAGNLLPINIRLINTVGQEVAVQRNISGNGTIQISTKALPAGIYTVLVESASGFTAKKVIISR